MSAVINAIHYCVPAQRLTQAELAARFGAGPVQSIAKMSGILERRVAPPGVTAADLAYGAARGLLAARGVAPATIDLLIFASQTPDYQIPATACVLQHRLGLRMDFGRSPRRARRRLVIAPAARLLCANGERGWNIDNWAIRDCWSLS